MNTEVEMTIRKINLLLLCFGLVGNSCGAGDAGAGIGTPTVPSGENQENEDKGKEEREKEDRADIQYCINNGIIGFEDDPHKGVRYKVDLDNNDLRVWRVLRAPESRRYPWNSIRVYSYKKNFSHTSTATNKIQFGEYLRHRADGNYLYPASAGEGGGILAKGNRLLKTGTTAIFMGENGFGIKFKVGVTTSRFGYYYFQILGVVLNKKNRIDGTSEDQRIAILKDLNDFGRFYYLVCGFGSGDLAPSYVQDLPSIIQNFIVEVSKLKATDDEDSISNILQEPKIKDDFLVDVQQAVINGYWAQYNLKKSALGTAFSSIANIRGNTADIKEYGYK